MTISFDEAVEYVGYVVDDAGSAGPLYSDRFKVVRHGNPAKRLDGGDDQEPCYRSRLIGWQCGAEPMFVSVHSYLDVRIDTDEAIALATDYLDEIGWFSDGPTDPDYII